jgi:hypothetical protein
MAKFAPSLFMDAAFDWLAAGDKVVVCSAQPTTYAEANATYALASATMVPVTDYTKAAGDVSGRKVTMAAKSGAAIATSGTATHLAVVKTGDSTLRYVTTVTSQALTSGGTVDIPAWKVEINAPT